MSQPPPPYSRQYNFAGWSVANPTTPHQGNKLDQEYNALLSSVNQTISRLSEIQKDDGGLRASSLDLSEVQTLVDSTAINAAMSASVSASGALSSKNAAAASATAAAASAASVNAESITAALATKAALIHTHAIADVTGLQTALNGKQASGSYAPASHTHLIADVTGLQTAIDGKAALSHTHSQSEVTGLTAALATKVDTSSQLAPRAWVSFDGTTTPPTIKSSYNVTSVARTTTGVYVVNFTNPMPDTNYCWIASARGTGASYYIAYQSTSGSAQTTTSMNIVTANSGAAVNCSLVNVMVYR